MKYIVMSVTSREKDGLKLELPFVFPEICVHLMMATIVKCMLEDQFPSCDIEPISAGQVSSTAFEDACYGESKTLGLASRGFIDSYLLKMCDYGSIYT